MRPSPSTGLRTSGPSTELRTSGPSTGLRTSGPLTGLVAVAVVLLAVAASSPAPAQEPKAQTAVEGPAPAISLSADFDNGSLGDWRLPGPDRVEITLTEASRGVWFHFRIEGVKGRTITFVVAIPASRNLRSFTAHYYDRANRPAYSYDRKQWELADPARVDEEARTMTFQVTFKQDPAWVAYSLPYTNDTLEALLAEFADSPYLRVRRLATSAEGRPVHWLVINENPDRTDQGSNEVLWLVARENGWESPGSWMADGLVRFALADEEEAKAFRHQVIANVIPILSPDAVAGGWMLYPVGEGKQIYLPAAYDRDLPEVRGLTGAISQWMNRGRTIDFVLRLHSFGWMYTQHEFRQEKYIDQNQVRFDGLMDRLHRAIPQSRWVREHVLPGTGLIRYCYRNFRISGGTIALGLGAKGNSMTPADFQEIGRALGQVLVSLYVPQFMLPAE